MLDQIKAELEKLSGELIGKIGAMDGRIAEAEKKLAAHLEADADNAHPAPAKIVPFQTLTPPPTLAPASQATPPAPVPPAPESTAAPAPATPTAPAPCVTCGGTGTPAPGTGIPCPACAGTGVAGSPAAN